MNIKIGDFVKGITNDYGITNTKMTRGVVINVYERNIEVRVLDHDDGETGVYTVDPKKFEVIGHQKQFDRAEVLKLLKDGCKKQFWIMTSGAQTSATQTSIILAIRCGAVACISKPIRGLLASLRIICVRCNAMTQIISKCATLFSVSLTSSIAWTSAVS